MKIRKTEHLLEVPSLFETALHGGIRGLVLIARLVFLLIDQELYRDLGRVFLNICCRRSFLVSDGRDRTQNLLHANHVLCHYLVALPFQGTSSGGADRELDGAED